MQRMQEREWIAVAVERAEARAHHGRTDRRQARSQCGVVQQFMGNATHRRVDPVEHGRMRVEFGLGRGDVNPPAAPQRDVDAGRVEQFPCEVGPASDGVRHQRA